MRGWIAVLSVVAAGAIAGVAASTAQFTDLSPDLAREPAIGYYTTPATDAVAQLKANISSGAARLAFDEATGYLRSVLDALELPVDSQLLVFARNSLQNRYITPRNPRAIFFNDAVAVGYIHGAEYLEIAAHDRRQGVVFYTIDQKRREEPVITRTDFCLQCHSANATVEVPGMLVRSIVTEPSGATVPRFANYVTDHRSPFDERWGGYYVTGRAAVTHLGNTTLADRSSPDPVVTSAGLDIASLAGRFDAEHYPTAHSDVVALLVFEHQMRMMNLITRIGWEARMVEGTRAAADVLRHAANEVVDYLLFVDEAPLDGPVSGTSGFAESFSARGPRDRRGRSLRDLDLTARLLKYRCSYMIYSDAFDALPPPARDAIYRRMWQVLSGADGSDRYRRLSDADRRAVIDILRDTKKDLPDYFQADTH
jgi:hypothetical protein